MTISKTKRLWAIFWMQFAWMRISGRVANRIASWFAPPYYGSCFLARLNKKGYISPTAKIHHDNLCFEGHIFIGDGVIIYKDRDGGPVKLGAGVHVHAETFIQTGSGGNLIVGSNSHIQPRCQFSAYMSSIQIGSCVQIAPSCAFYPYDHSFAPSQPIFEQPLKTKGGIFIDDDAWLGFGVIVLDGVRIGKGAVIGAGSVVTNDIPDKAVAFGVPARVVRMR